MKKFSVKINETKDDKIVATMNSMSDKQLEDRLEYLRIELKDLQDEMLFIRSLQKERSDNSDRVSFKDYPNSIFDLNKDQLDKIFDHDHGISEYRYKKSSEYLYQIRGFYNSVFNPNTKQVQMSISLYYILDDDDNINITDDIIKNFKFLCHNMKKDKNFLKINIIGKYNDHSYNDHILYYNDNKITLQSNTYNIKTVNMDNIKSLIEYIANYDLGFKNDDW